MRWKLFLLRLLSTPPLIVHHTLLTHTTRLEIVPHLVLVLPQVVERDVGVVVVDVEIVIQFIVKSIEVRFTMLPFVPNGIMVFPHFLLILLNPLLRLAIFLLLTTRIDTWIPVLPLT